MPKSYKFFILYATDLETLLPQRQDLIRILNRKPFYIGPKIHLINKN